MPGRDELTEAAWRQIGPLLPANGGRGGQWYRAAVNAILWKLRSGAPWRDLPERCGSWKSAHERLRRWAADGTWDQIFAAAQVKGDGIPVEWTVGIDSSIVRAHQHAAAGARKKGRRRCDEQGAGAFKGRLVDQGPSRRRRTRSAASLTLFPSDQVERRRRKRRSGGRPPHFDREAYRQRNMAERCFNRFKQWRDLATRYAMRAAVYRASLVIAATKIWLNDPQERS